MTPDQLLRLWEKSYFKLTRLQSLRFKKKVDYLGLLDYDYRFIRPAIRNNQKLEDVLAEARDRQAQDQVQRKRRAEAEARDREAEDQERLKRRRDAEARGVRNTKYRNKGLLGSGGPSAGFNRSKAIGDLNRRIDRTPEPKRLCLACGALEVMCRCR